MDKKHKSNLIITLLCTVIVGVSLYFLYDNFRFQTYSTKIYYDYILTSKNKKCILEGFELYKDTSNFHCGDGLLTLDNIDSLQEGNSYDVVFTLKSKEKDYDLIYPIIYNKGYSYTLGNDNTYNKLESINSVTLKVMSQEQKELYKQNITMKPVQAIYCFNKDFRIENASISSDYMRLGYLTTNNTSIMKKYPEVSLEYRYLKDEKGDEDDDNNYIVFKKITMPSKDYVNKMNYDTYVHDQKERGSLLKKKLSVVVIFSNDKGKTYTFKMNFKNEAGES